MARSAVISVLFVVLIASLAWAGPGKQGASANDLLDRMTEALGGKNGGGAALDRLPGYHISFDRRVMDNPSGRVIAARHLLWVAGDSVRMDIEITEGDGVSSRLVSHGGKGWVIGEAERVRMDSDKITERLEEVMPAGLWQPAVRWGRELPAGLRTATVHAPDERTRLLRTRDGVELWLDSATNRPVGLRVPDPAGLIEYAYEGWRQHADGVVLPDRTEFRRDGELLSSVRLLGFEVLDGPQADLFAGEVLPLPVPKAAEEAKKP